MRRIGLTIVSILIDGILRTLTHRRAIQIPKQNGQAFS